MKWQHCWALSPSAVLPEHTSFRFVTDASEAFSRHLCTKLAVLTVRLSSEKAQDLAKLHVAPNGPDREISTVSSGKAKKVETRTWS